MQHVHTFPFSAIVGQEDAKLALLCNAVNPAIGGVLLSGDKGTGKSTMVRALADVLPEVEVVKECPFNCNPYKETEMCEVCLEKMRRGEIEVEKRKMRVIDLPLSVSVDRLVGTIDIEKALKEGIRALHPGILAKANRNILYIDEVNLLDDYIADILLDSAAMGWNVIEREGISLKHPSRFILVGSMNPEEGELRPQILDRFGLFVQIEAISDVEQRMEILRRVEEFQENPVEFRREFEEEQKAIRDKIVEARRIVNEVEVDGDLVKALVKIIVEMGIKTHRAEIVTLRTAKAIAALDGRKKVTFEDIRRAMQLSLPHRLKDKPFDEFKTKLDLDSDLDGECEKNSESEKGSGRRKGDERGRKNEMNKRGDEKHRENREKKESKEGKINKNKNGENCNKKGKELESVQSKGSKGNNSMEFTNEKNVNLNLSLNLNLNSKVNSRKNFLRGSRDERVSSFSGHGVHIYSVPLSVYTVTELSNAEVDVFATLKSKVVGGSQIFIKVKKVRVPRLTAIVLDVSGSMLVGKRIAIAKAIAKKLVESSYVKRDFLSLIVFRGNSAEVLVPPTKKYSEVIKALDRVRVGGRTPLSSALNKLDLTVRAFRVKYRNSVGRAIIVTDGRANTSMGGKVKEEVVEELKKLKKLGVKMEVYDTGDRIFKAIPSFVEVMEKVGGAKVWKV